MQASLNSIFLVLFFQRLYCVNACVCVCVRVRAPKEITVMNWNEIPNDSLQIFLANGLDSPESDYHALFSACMNGGIYVEKYAYELGMRSEALGSTHKAMCVFDIFASVSFSLSLILSNGIVVVAIAIVAVATATAIVAMFQCFIVFLVSFFLSFFLLLGEMYVWW